MDLGKLVNYLDAQRSSLILLQVALKYTYYSICIARPIAAAWTGQVRAGLKADPALGLGGRGDRLGPMTGARHFSSTALVVGFFY